MVSAASRRDLFTATDAGLCVGPALTLMLVSARDAICRPASLPVVAPRPAQPPTASDRHATPARSAAETAVEARTGYALDLP